MTIYTPDKWVVLHIDRYFDKNIEYGIGPELRYEIDGTIFRDVILSKENTCYDDDKLIVNAGGGRKIILEGEPKHDWFISVFYSKWKKWDELVGKHNEDRSDYEPCSFNTMAIICDFLKLKKLDKNDSNIMFYNKKYTT